MKFRNTLILLILFIASSLFSQAQLAIENEFVGMGYVTLGSQYISFTELETALASSTLDYPVPPESMYTFGAGGIFMIKDWVIALEGDGFMSATESFGPYKTRLSGGYVTLDTGFSMVRTRSFTVYPLLGIGAGSLSYKIFQEPDSIPFNEVLNNPKNQVTLNQKSIFFHLAIAAQYHFKFATNTDDAGNYFIGLRGGYRTTMKTFDWYIQDTQTKLSEGPLTNLDGAYIQIMFGVSGENFILID